MMAYKHFTLACLVLITLLSRPQVLNGQVHTSPGIEQNVLSYVSATPKVVAAARTLEKQGGHATYMVRPGAGKYSGLYHVQLCRGTFDRVIPVVNFYVKRPGAPIMMLDARSDKLVRIAALKTIPLGT